MKFNLILTGIIFGLVGGFFVGQISSETILRLLEENSTKIIVICVVIFCFLAFLLLFSERIIKSLTSARNTNIVTWFDEVSEVLFSTVSISKTSQEKLKNASRDALAIYIGWRTRSILFGMLIAITVVVVGSISTHVIIEQNSKLDAQNNLIAEQNGAVRVQLLLAESARYDVYQNRVSEIVVDIAEDASRFRSDEREVIRPNQEAQISYVWFEDRKWDSIRSILGLVNPYPVFDTETLTQAGISFNNLDIEYLSRERGQILKALLTERINMDHVDGLNFDYADMRDFVLRNPRYVDGIEATGCGVRRSSLASNSLRNVDFSGSIISSVDLNIFPREMSQLNVSSTTFYNSSIGLPFFSRLPLDGERPGHVTIMDSTVLFGFDTEKVELDNIAIIVADLDENGTNCAEFSFAFDENREQIVPEISFSGSTLSTLGFEGFGSESRQEVFLQLVTLAGNSEETIVTFEKVVDTVILLLVPRENDRTDDLRTALIEANKGVDVRLLSTDISAHDFPEGSRLTWIDKGAKGFHLEFE